MYLITCPPECGPHLSVHKSLDGGRPCAVVEDGQLTKQFARAHLTSMLIVFGNLNVTLCKVGVWTNMAN